MARGRRRRTGGAADVRPASAEAVRPREQAAALSPSIPEIAASLAARSGGASLDRAGVLLRLQRNAGNAHVQRLVTSHRPVTTPMHAATGIQRLSSESSPEDIAEEIYDSLDWYDEEERCFRALKLGYAQYSAVKRAFESEHGSIWSYLKDNLSTEEVITAYAYFIHGHTHDLQVGLARALIPVGTRDAEIHRILGSVPPANKQALQDAYNYDYSDVGEGTLRADIIDDQSGWELEKSLALLDHDLNEAEKLYFDSVAITGTHEDAVVERLQRISGGSDPNAFARLEQEWEQFVRSSDGYTTAANRPSFQFTDMDIRAAMRSELSGEEYGFAMAAIDGGRERSAAAAAAGGAVPEGTQGAEGAPVMTEEQLFNDERIRLEMQMKYIRSAAEGAGTNEQQIFDAVDAIRDIWMKRIQRAEGRGDTASAQQYRSEWTATQDEIRPIVNDEMRESGTENLRVRLQLSGALKPADELYLADQDFDDTLAVSIVSKAWAKGEVDQLKADADSPRVDAEGRTLRPRFEPKFAVPVTSGAPFSRIAILLRDDLDHIGRGAKRLKFELDEGTADSDCEAAKNFLSLPGISEARRAAVVEAFVALQGLGNRTEPTPTKKFLAWLGERYEQSTATWAMRDLLDPTTDPQELLTRAQGRHAAAHSGLFDSITTDFARDWGHLTGEDTVEVEAEALARLEFIVSSGTTPAEVQGLLALTGKTSISELAQFQYSEYLERLEELRALKRTIAEGIATAIEIAAAAAITAATGGAAGAALASAIGSAIAGMLAREALLGTEYELMSDENLKQLVVAAATAGVGEVLGPAIKGMDALKRLGSAEKWVGEALVEGSKALTSEAVSASLSDNAPTLEAFSASVIRIAGSAVGAGITAHVGEGIDDLPIAQRLGPTIKANVAGNVVSGAFDQASTMTAGTGNMTAVDIAAGFGTHLVKDVTSGIGSAIGSVLAADVAASRGVPGAEGGETEGGGPKAWNAPDLSEDEAVALYRASGVKKPMSDDRVREKFREGLRFNPLTRRWNRVAPRPRTGTPGRIISEGQVGDAVVIKSEVGDAPGRLGHERLLPSGVEVGLAGWERAHSQGNITGAESDKGIRYAPPAVNQELQRLGIEQHIADINKQKADGVQVLLTTETRSHEGTLRLKSITYKLELSDGNGSPTRIYEAEITVSDNRTNPRVDISADPVNWDAVERYLKPISAGGNDGG